MKLGGFRLIFRPRGERSGREFEPRKVRDCVYDKPLGF